MTETFYDVLGVAEDATTDEIETAYRERLKETHPDVSDDEDAGRATQTLIEARDVLVDEDERTRYDRVGHAAYVGDAPDPSTSDSTSDGSDDSDDGGATASGGTGTESRTRRERRATERVDRERRARQQQRTARQHGDERNGHANATASTAATEHGTAERIAEETKRRRTRDPEPTGTEAGNTYSVREDIEMQTSRGPILPSGRELTLLGIFFALYPVLLFSAVLPAFPTFVNLVLGACTLLTISYLQSMPRVALLLFGGWSALSLVGLALLGIEYLSLIGLVVLAGTLLPFGFSVLTASALRY